MRMARTIAAGLVSVTAVGLLVLVARSATFAMGLAGDEEDHDWGVVGVVFYGVLLVALLVVTWFALRTPKAGGLALLVGGMVIFTNTAMNDIGTPLLLAAALPPLAGALLFMAALRSQRPEATEARRR